MIRTSFRYSAHTHTHTNQNCNVYLLLTVFRAQAMHAKIDACKTKYKEVCVRRITVVFWQGVMVVVVCVCVRARVCVRVCLSVCV